MKKVLLLVSLFFLTSEVFASNKIPRQKIKLEGLILKNAPSEVSVSDIENFKPQKDFDLFDPYNKDLKTHFYCTSFLAFIERYMEKSVTTVRVVAIDGYKVDIKVSDIKKDELYLAYKDNNGYLTVDRMGPIRVIENRSGKIDKDLLAKIGVNWVWQVKSFNFIK